MLTFFQAIILGIVEGITEFLPISSTAHLILTADILKLTQTEFLKSFEIIIQFGAILAVVVLYWKTLWKVEMIKKLVVAFIPTGILGLVFYKIIKTYLLGNVSLVLWTMFLGGIFLIIFEKWHKEKQNLPSTNNSLHRDTVKTNNIESKNNFFYRGKLVQGSLEDICSISYRQCLYIGLFQSISMIPGVSRSAATILGGLAIGLKRKTIVEFSFLLAVPTMLAATGLDMLKNYKSFSLSESHLLAVGFLSAFVMAIIGIKFLLAYVQKRTFVAFGIYRILVAILFWVK